MYCIDREAAGASRLVQKRGAMRCPGRAGLRTRIQPMDIRIRCKDSASPCTFVTFFGVQFRDGYFHFLVFC